MPLATGLLGVAAKSPALLHWRARDLALTALTGQPATFARTSVVTSTGVDGANLSAGYGLPAWRAVDFDIDGITRELAITLGGGDTLNWRLDNATGGLDTGRALTIYSVFSLRDVTQVNARVLQLGKSDDTNARLLLILASSGNLQFQHFNGTSSVSTSNIAVANGNIVEIRCVFNANGSIFAGYRIGAFTPGNTNSETVTATTGTLTPAGWSQSTLNAGSIGGSNQCSMDLMLVKMLSGAQSMQTMRDLF